MQRAGQRPAAQRRCSTSGFTSPRQWALGLFPSRVSVIDNTETNISVQSTLGQPAVSWLSSGRDLRAADVGAWTPGSNSSSTSHG